MLLVHPTRLINSTSPAKVVAKASGAKVSEVVLVEERLSMGLSVGNGTTVIVHMVKIASAGTYASPVPKQGS